MNFLRDLFLASTAPPSTGPSELLRVNNTNTESEESFDDATEEKAQQTTFTKSMLLANEWRPRIFSSDAYGKGGNRNVYMNQERFDETFQFMPAPPRKHHPFRKHLACCLSPTAFLRFLLSFLPILNWLPRYKWRESLVGDAMAGLTVGIVHVPQGIAYAILTGVEPVYGLYSSFFGVLFYMFFGTSRYVSIGSFAIISLMTGVSCREIHQRIENDYVAQEISYWATGGGSSGDSNDQNGGFLSLLLRNYTRDHPRMEFTHEELVQALTLTTGLMQLVMALLRVEFLAAYLSDQLVSGFSTGAAVHVVVVQAYKLLQIPTAAAASGGTAAIDTGPGYLLKHIRRLVLLLPTTNRLSLGISVAAFLFLYVGKDMVNPRMRRRGLPAPIPFELLLVIAATAISALFRFQSSYDIKVVNRVPVGLPVAHLPRLELIPYMLGDALEIAFVVLALHLSMCKIFNRKMGTHTDNNLELYAMGFVASFSSFFSTYPVSSSIGRSMLNVECGARSQLSAAFTSALLLVVILFLGSLLSPLPMCVLAVIIIYSMKSVFQKMPRELLHLWRVAKVDFMIWVVTFFSTLVLDVMQGLALAVGFALLTTVFRIQWPRWHLLSRLNGTEDYRDSGRYAHVTDVDSVRIFRFDAPLLFTNVEHFANSARRAVTDVGLLQRGASARVARAKSPPQSPGPVMMDGSANEQAIIGPFGANGTVGRLTSLETKHPELRRESAWRRLLLPSSNSVEYHSRGSVGANYGASMVISSVVEHLIIDCSGFTFVDYSSVNALIDLFQQLRYNQINVYFAGAKAPIRDTFEVCRFYDSVPREHFYPTIHDAVLAAIDRKRLFIRKRGIPEAINVADDSVDKNGDGEERRLDHDVEAAKPTKNPQQKLQQQINDVRDVMTSTSELRGVMVNSYSASKLVGLSWPQLPAGELGEKFGNPRSGNRRKRPDELDDV